MNYLNPKCPYAEFTNDVLLGQKGYEMIKINQFSDATYLIYETKSSNYESSCKLGNK